MQENSTSSVVNEVLAPLLHTIQFYASLVGGGWIFHNVIYPFAYFAKTEASLVQQLPIYAINVLAFGCLAYVASRPLVLLLIEALRALEHAVRKTSSSQ